MKETLNEQQFVDAMKRDEYNSYSIPALKTLFEYLEQLEEDIGEDIEFDKVAIRCDWDEWENLNEFLDSHPDFDTPEIKNDDGEIEDDKLRQGIEGNTTLLLINEDEGLKGGFLTQVF